MLMLMCLRRQHFNQQWRKIWNALKWSWTPISVRISTMRWRWHICSISRAASLLELQHLRARQRSAHRWSVRCCMLQNERIFRFILGQRIASSLNRRNAMLRSQQCLRNGRMIQNFQRMPLHGCARWFENILAKLCCLEFRQWAILRVCS